MLTKRFVGSVLTAAFVLGVSVVSVARAEEMKVGVVDMQKALQTVEAGKSAKTQLEKDFNAKKKEFEKEKSTLDKMAEEFKKQSLVMNDEARAKKQGELQERAFKLQEAMGKAQADIQKKELELTRPIIMKLRTIAGDLAKQKGYSILLEKNENTVIYSQEKDDLTNDLIATYNKSKG